MMNPGFAHLTPATDGIATLTFGHPQHNSLPGALLEQMIGLLEQAGHDEAVRVIVLRSEGERTFCAGANFDELAAISDLDESQAFFNGFGRILNAMRRCPKIIVGRVQGRAVGGGIGIAAATDYCMASHYASIRLSELTVGFGPFVIAPAVERKIGLAAFGHLALNPGEWQTANWAKDRGLFQEVFDTTEQLDAYLAHFCQKLSAYSPEALIELKKVLWAGTDHWDTLLPERAATSARLALTPAAKRAIAEFKKGS
jgi:methylglutaconyl-CoA hydratase